jgi:hypothetical protein
MNIKSRKSFAGMSTTEKVLGSLSHPVFIWFIGITIISVFAYCNMFLCYIFIKNFPKSMTILVNLYHTEPQLFRSIPYLFHLYFALLIYTGLPIIVFLSLVLSFIYLKIGESNKILYVLFMPVIFAISNGLLAEIWLSFT